MCIHNLWKYVHIYVYIWIFMYIYIFQHSHRQPTFPFPVDVPREVQKIVKQFQLDYKTKPLSRKYSIIGIHLMFSSLVGFETGISSCKLVNFSYSSLLHFGVFIHDYINTNMYVYITTIKNSVQLRLIYTDHVFSSMKKSYQ